MLKFFRSGATVDTQLLKTAKVSDHYLQDGHRPVSSIEFPCSCVISTAINWIINLTKLFVAALFSRFMDGESPEVTINALAHDAETPVF